MNRRPALLAGVAAAAAAAGAGWSLWSSRRNAAAAPSPAPADAPAAAGLWSLRFARPEGGELVMASLRGQPLVLNFWATWCPPCVKEMPELDRFHQAFKGRGWQVVALAIDQLEPVRAFLNRSPVQFAVGLAGMAGLDLTRQLGNPAGALPFSVVFAADGRAVQHKLGETSYAELARWAQEIG